MLPSSSRIASKQSKHPNNEALRKGEHPCEEIHKCTQPHLLQHIAVVHTRHGGGREATAGGRIGWGMHGTGNTGNRLKVQGLRMEGAGHKVQVLCDEGSTPLIRPSEPEPV